MCYGCIGTFTGRQLCDRQLLALETECDKVFIERGASASAKSRPVYEELILQLKAVTH